MDNPNTRWTSNELLTLWNDHTTTLIMRSLWYTILEQQTSLGTTPEPHPDALPAYAAAMGTIDPNRIRTLEQQTGHHLQAQLMHYEETAGTDPNGNPWGLLHRTLTSCDITDLTTQIQILTSLHLTAQRLAAVLERLIRHAEQPTNQQPIAGRTHGQPAQPTTTARRIATWIDQLLYARTRFNLFRYNYPLRVLGGAIGNRNDLARILPDPELIRTHTQTTADAMLGSIAAGQPHSVATGQTYHRILDLDLASTLTLLTAPLTNLAATYRALDLLGHAAEQTNSTRVGSSAMPHKQNPRHLERITALHRLLRGHLTTLANTSADQLFEGDVADTAARRVAIPGALYAAEGILNTTIVALDRLTHYHHHAADDYRQHQLFMATGQLLETATNRPTYPGQTRHDIHAKLREHTAEAAGSGVRFQLLVEADPTLGIHRHDFDQIRDTPDTGQADQQTEAVLKRARRIVERYPHQTRTWNPRDLL